MGVPFWDNSGSTIGPGAEGKTFADEPWDVVRLLGNPLPGICRVTVESSRRVQHRKSDGTDGATPTFRGLNPAKVNIEVDIWTPAQHDIWNNEVVPRIWPLAGKDITKLGALDIVHPATQGLGIKSVIVESLTDPRPGSVHGAKTIRLSCVQYVPHPKGKKSAVKTVDGSLNVAVKEPFQQNTPSVNVASAPPSATDSGPTAQSLPQTGST